MARRGRRRHLELVGLAGVGKSHLKRQLQRSYPRSCVDVVTVRVSYSHVMTFIVAFYRVMPFLRFLLSAGGSRLRARLLYARRLLHYAWQEEQAQRLAGSDDFLISEEGWYHKLRQVRRLVNEDLSVLDLPPIVQRRFFRPDCVLFLTADPIVICARKLERKGRDVTPESLEAQYRESEAIGQWQEQDWTKRDLVLAKTHAGVPHLIIDYCQDYDVDEQLVPRLLAMGFHGGNA